MNIFEKAVRNKYRFTTRKGNLTVEDLLELSLQSLDRVGKTIMTDIREQEDSLIEGLSNTTNEDKLIVVKHIIREKQLKLQTPVSLDDSIKDVEEVL